nr:Transketolase 2 [Klebsiella pneumoniae]
MSRRELANAIRALSMDAVQKANSGHPGAPMGMADIAEVLWNDFLKHNPQNPDWVDRDRFILSNGHASMLLYSLLHLTGYDLPLSELKQFRQLHSKTPGHPEHGYTLGWKPPPARWARAGERRRDGHRRTDAGGAV